MSQTTKFLIIITLFFIALLLAFYFKTPVTQAPVQPLLVGADRDEHGCIGSAGYSWCQARQKCLRIWEEPCQPQSQLGYIRGFYQQDSRQYLVFEQILWLSLADGTCISEEVLDQDLPLCNPNGFLIVDAGQGEQNYLLATDIVHKVSDFEYSESGQRDIAYSDFQNLGTEHFALVPYILTIEGERVFEIQEQYVP